ncbi:MAG: hypothetical protein COU32_03135 [Candidatus Magasanikbacteria bacterium CG10_big_fil_rev_8_21_14_0_10_42_10]|nr:MAG: hypothetical protein COU32_03135 [Candidatus Magasanikbacteria bacterium CG10_big_fil_rev_8_21_14_0_10_42_10]
MYENLNNIGLKDFLVKCCGGTIHEDPWLRSLDSYVSTLSSQNLISIKQKIRPGLTDNQKNDLLHEIEIALVFHPKADFVQENNEKKEPDLFDPSTGINIEIKSLNEGEDEQERHAKGGKLLIQNKALQDEEKADLKYRIFQILKNKTKYHLECAVKQLNNNGRVYLVFDYDNFIRENTGLYPGIIDEEETKKVIEDFIDSSIKYKNISVTTIYHGNLREMVKAAGSSKE